MNQRRLRIPEYVTWFALGDAVVLIDRRNQQRKELNGTAAELWRQLGGCRSQKELSRWLAPRAEGSEQDAREFVEDWAEALHRAELLYPLAAVDHA